MIVSAKDLEVKDRNFITDSWLKSYRTSPEARYMLTSIYKDEFWNRINNELIVSQVDIFRDKEDPKKIEAYCVYRNVRFDHKSEQHSGYKPLIKYLYVTYNSRKKYIGSNILKIYSHKGYAYMSYITSDMVALCKRNNLKHIYLPYMKEKNEKK